MSLFFLLRVKLNKFELTFIIEFQDIFDCNFLKSFQHLVMHWKFKLSNKKNIFKLYEIFKLNPLLKF